MDRAAKKEEKWCRGLGSNQRSASARQIYSLLPLTARPPLRHSAAVKSLPAPGSRFQGKSARVSLAVNWRHRIGNEAAQRARPGRHPLEAPRQPFPGGRAPRFKRAKMPAGARDSTPAVSARNRNSLLPGRKTGGSFQSSNRSYDRTAFPANQSSSPYDGFLILLARLWRAKGIIIFFAAIFTILTLC